MYKLFHLWPVEVPLTWLLVSHDITPVNVDSFFAFPYERMSQVYIVNLLHQTRDQPFLQGYQVLFPENGSWKPQYRHKGHPCL